MHNYFFTALVASSLISAGCSTAGKDAAVDIATMFYAQDRTYTSFKMSGFSEMHLKAAEGEEITLESVSPLDPLSVYPRDPSAIAQITDGLTKIGAVATAAYVGGKLADTPQTVLQPAPTIVRPEVIFAPAP